MRKVFSTLLLLINIFFVILFLSSTMAGIVSPSVCIWFSLLSYAYPILLVINVLFILLWLFFSNKYFLISLVAIVIRFTFIPLYYQISGSDKITEKDVFGIMSFNVHQFTWKDDAIQSAIVLLDEKKPDIICFQEFVSKANGISILDTLKQRGYRYGLMKKNKILGTTIASKFPIIAKGVIDSGRNIYVDVKIGNDTVRVYNIHLASYRLNDEDKDEIDRIKRGDVTENSRKTVRKFKNTSLKHEAEIKAIRRHAIESPYRIIICGDFNDTPASYSYQQIRNYFTDSFVEKGEGFSTTYNGKFPAFRIDYIFHDKNLKTDSYSRIKADISDHYPVFVTIEIPETCNKKKDTRE